MTSELQFVVLEDSEEDAELIERTLRKGGQQATIQRAADRASFERAALDPATALVLSDHKLPGYSGVEALRFVRANRPNLPFIFVTGTVGEEAVADLIREGAADCVFKYALGKLTLAVERALDSVRVRAQKEQAEAELREQLHFMRVLADAIPQPLYTLDSDLRLMDCNRAFLEMVGVTAEQVIGRRPSECLEPGDASLAEEIAAAVVRAGGATITRARRTLRDGRSHDLVCHGAPFTRSDGTGGGLVVLIVDVTELTETQETLQRTLALQKAVLENLEQAVLVVSQPDRRVVMANSAVGRIFGFAKDEIVGATTEAFHPDRESYLGLDEASRSVLDRGEVYSAERPLRRRSGELFPAAVRACLLDPSAGREGGIVVVVQDITERRRAEEELRRRERDLESIVTNAPDIIVRVDRDLNITFVSPAVERILGVPPQPFVTDWRPAFKPLGVTDQDEEQWCEAMRQSISLRRPGTIEAHFRRPDGRVVWLEAVMVPELDAGGEAAGLLLIARDVSGQKEAEQALAAIEEKLQVSQRLEAIGQLAGGVAHDFGNMLTVIIGYTDLALSLARDRADIRGHLEEVKKAGSRAADLTGQLLLFAKRAPMAKAPVRIGDCVRNLQKMLGRLLGEGITLRCELAPDERVVLADAGKIEQVIMNLAINARDAMPSGGELTIATANAGSPGAEPGAGPRVLLSVADNGMGMDEQTQRRIFEPFFTTKPPDKGTGLGLSVVYGIVGEHNGSIECESAPGRGTRFDVYLPAHEAARARTEDGGRAASSAPKGNGERVLVVEDDESIRDLVRAALQGHGYAATAVATVSDALRLLAQPQDAPHIVITDMALPDGNGLQVLRQARSRGVARVILMTGYIDDRILTAELERSGRRVIYKPFGAQRLLGEVARALRED